MAQTQKQSHKVRVNVLFDGTTTTAGSVQVALCFVRATIASEAQEHQVGDRQCRLIDGGIRYHHGHRRQPGGKMTDDMMRAGGRDGLLTHLFLTIAARAEAVMIMAGATITMITLVLVEIVATASIALYG